MTKHKKSSNKKYSKEKKPKKKVKPNNTKRKRLKNKSFKINSKGAVGKDKKLHHYGYTEEEKDAKDGFVKHTIQERNLLGIYPPSFTKLKTLTFNYNSLSDEFINEYIPEDLDTPVTWRDVLTMGMIHEQKIPDQTNRILRPDIQYNNIEIKYPDKERLKSIERLRRRKELLDHSPIPAWFRID